MRGRVSDSGRRRDRMIGTRTRAVNAGSGQDVRQGGLKSELQAVDPAALVWAVLRGEALKALDAEIAAGLVQGHFAASLDQGGGGLIELRLEFKTADQAVAFRDQLNALISAVVTMAKGSTVGNSLAQLHEQAALTVNGPVVALAARVSL